jgi:hypothetical protein
MRHPTEGTLRRLLDEPAGVADADRRHLAGCDQCLAALDAIGADARLVHAGLSTADVTPVDLSAVDVDAAWQRFSASSPARRPVAAAHAPAGMRTVAGASRARRSLDFLRRPLVAGLVVVAVLGGAGTAAANGWLQIFRTEQITPVSLSASDLVALPDLSAYGDLVVTGGGDLHAVPDAATAAKQTGLQVPQVGELPRGVDGSATYQVGDQVSAVFTFSAARTEQAAGAAGESAPPMPTGLDGAQVRLVAGPGVAAVWSQPAGVPSLIVARAAAPTASSTGVSFETVRNYLLSLPGLPDRVAAQLRSFTADGSTLPLPVPADQFSTSTADVNGASATVLVSRDRSMAAVVWTRDGVVTAVAGALDADEVLTVARDLR